jgi:hypothetical protein
MTSVLAYAYRVGSVSVASTHEEDIMPSPQEILAGLGRIANEWQWLAIVWHAYFAVLAGGLLLGVRLSKRWTGFLLSLPLFSVSALAWATANPFNGTIFALVGLGAVALAARLPSERVQLASPWIVALGALIALFGWVYPHFLETTSFVPYLYAAPTGLIPCPTLSIVLGFGLMMEGLGSRPWALLMGAAGLFYGIFGAFLLGVTIDLVLLVAALLILIVAYMPHQDISKDTGKAALAH